MREPLQDSLRQHFAVFLIQFALGVLLQVKYCCSPVDDSVHRQCSGGVFVVVVVVVVLTMFCERCFL